MSDDGPIVVEIEAWLEHLVPRFLDNRRRDVADLRRAAEAGDFDAVHRIGHNLRGVAGGYGFDALAGLGERLEAAAAARSVEAARACADALEAFMRAARIVYR